MIRGGKGSAGSRGSNSNDGKGSRKVGRIIRGEIRDSEGILVRGSRFK